VIIAKSDCSFSKINNYWDIKFYISDSYGFLKQII
jgi:hypothetical protein